MLREVTVVGYKALADVTVTLEPLTVIVGANASGKSSFLDAVENILGGLSYGADVRFGHAVTARGLRTHGREGDLKLIARADDGLAQLTVRADGDVSLGLESPDGALHTSVTFPSRDIKPAVRLRLNTALLTQPSRIKRQYTRVLADGEGLAAVLQRLQLRDPERFQEIVDALKRVVPSVAGIRTGQENLGTEDGEDAFAYLEVRTLAGGWSRASELSEGTLLALGLLTVVFGSPGVGLLLIDDVDHGLHPRAQVQLVACLRSVMREKPELQIICTTHSPYILNCFAPEEVRFFALDSQGHTVASRLVDHPEWPHWKDTFASGEFWASVGDEWVAGATG